MRSARAAAFTAGFTAFAVVYPTQPLIPAISESLGVSAADGALSVSVTALGMVVALAFWTVTGRRPLPSVAVMRASLAVATILCGATALADQLAALLVLRSLLGFAVGTVPALAVARFRAGASPRDATAIAGFYIAGTTAGGVLGRLVASHAAGGEWRAGLLATAVLAALGTLAFLALTVGSTDAPAVLPSAPGDTSTASPLRVRVLLYLAGFVAMGAYTVVGNILPFHLMADPLDLSQEAVGLVYLAGLAGGAGALLVVRLARAVGTRPAVATMVVVMTVGVLVSIAESSLLTFAGLGLVTAGFFATHTLLSRAASDAAPGRAFGSSSVYAFWYYLGSAVFGWAGGLVLPVVGWPGLMMALAALTLALVPITIAASARSPGDA